MAESRCFFDISIGGEEAGRVVIKLFKDSAPKTAENFERLCRGEKASDNPERRLWYQNCVVHRVIPGFMFQTGDFENGDGTGGESIYGRTFADEENGLRFDRPALVAMANSGPDTNGAQFFVTFAACRHLDGKHTIFGRVCQGLGVLRQVEKLQTDDNDRPLAEVRVRKCGLLVRSAGAKKSSATKKYKKSAAKERPISAGKIAHFKKMSPVAKKGAKSETQKVDDRSLRRPFTLIGKSGRVLKGRGFTPLRHVGSFGGVGYHSPTPSPERPRREIRRRGDQRHYSPSAAGRRAEPRYKKVYNRPRRSDSGGRSQSESRLQRGQGRSRSNDSCEGGGNGSN